MPDPTGIQPPYLDPSQYPQYVDVQRKQMIANMLLGAMQRSGQTPADWNSMKVVPRRGLMTNLAPLVSGLMAGKALTGAQQAEQNYFQGLYGGGQAPSTPQGSLAGATPSVQSGPSGAPPVANAAPSAPAQPAGANPMLLTGNPGTSQMLLNLMGPQEYGKGLAARYQPTELEKQLHAAGIDPASPLGQQMLQTQVAKTGYVPPVDVRPGGTLVDPFSRQPFFTGPQGNIQTVWGPNGPVAGPVPGGQEAQARAEGLETAAKVGNTPGTYPTAGGGSTVGYPGDILGTPPAMRGSPAVASVRAPIAAPASGAGTTGGQAPLAAGADPWASMPKLYVPQGIGQADLYQQGRLKAAADKDSALSGKLGDEAALAEQQLEYNREAAGSLPNAETGPLSEWLTHNRSTLLELGVPESLVPSSGSVTPTLELNKALKNAALQGARQIYGPRMTQTEVKLQTEEMSPSAGMMRDAIGSLMQQNDIRSLYAKQRAQDYNRYQSAGGDPNKFESWYATKFPLTRFASAARASSADIQAELKRRGLAPP